MSKGLLPHVAVSAKEIRDEAEIKAARILERARTTLRTDQQRGEHLRQISEKQDSAAETRETANQYAEKLGLKGGAQGEGEGTSGETETQRGASSYAYDRAEDLADADTVIPESDFGGDVPDQVDGGDEPDDNQDDDADNDGDTGFPDDEDPESVADIVDPDEGNDDPIDDDAVKGIHIPPGPYADSKQGPERTGLLSYLKEIRREVLTKTAREFWQSNGAWDLAVLSSITTTVGAGQISSALIEKQYDKLFGAEAKAKRAANAPLIGPEITERPGVDKFRVYSRPFNEVEYRLAQGDTHDEAMRAGMRRLRDLAATDLQLAKTKTAQQSYKDTKHIHRYRRIPGGDNPCPLCLLAATQVYYTYELMPIHPNCECDVEPIDDDEDPRKMIWIPRSYLEGPTSTVEDDGTITRPGSARRGGKAKRASDIRRYLKDIADETGQVYDDEPGDEPIKDLDQLITVHHHGEIGPVLTYAGQHFRGPDDLPTRPKAKLPEQVTNRPSIKVGPQLQNALTSTPLDLPPVGASMEEIDAWNAKQSARATARRAVTKVSARKTAENVAVQKAASITQFDPSISGMVRRSATTNEFGADAARRLQQALDKDYNTWRAANPPSARITKDADALEKYNSRHNTSADIDGYIRVRDNGIDGAKIKDIQDYLMFKHADTIGEVRDFDATGISVTAARSVLKAADDMATKYPDLYVKTIRPDYLSPEERSVIAMTEGDGAVPGDTRSIVFNRDAMAKHNQTAFAAMVRRNVATRFYMPGMEDDPWRSAFVHEWGHVVDNRGTQRARMPLNKLATDLFKKENPDYVKPWSPAQYRTWMNQPGRISGYSLNSRALMDPRLPRARGEFEDVSLNNAEALAQAFEDVERRGDAASDLSKAIHASVVREYGKAADREWPTDPDDGSPLKSIAQAARGHGDAVRAAAAEKVAAAKSAAAARLSAIKDGVPDHAQLDQDAYNTIRANGGVTIDLKGRSPNKGYAYAPYKGTETVVAEKDFTPEHLDKFIDDHYEELNQPGNNLGVWTEGGKVYMDISRVGSASAATISKAQKADQLAVFDLQHFNEIQTGTITDGKYTPVGKAADIHNQYRAKIAGTNEKPSAPSASEIPAGKQPRTKLTDEEKAARAAKQEQKARQTELAAKEKAKGFGTVQDRIKGGTEIKPVYVKGEDGKLKYVRVEDEDNPGHFIRVKQVDAAKTWARISDKVLEANWRNAIQQSAPWAVKAGKAWYPGIHKRVEELTTKYGDAFQKRWGVPLTPDLTASFVAYYSMNNSWAGNLVGVRKFLDGTGVGFRGALKDYHYAEARDYRGIKAGKYGTKYSLPLPADASSRQRGRAYKIPGAEGLWLNYDFHVNGCMRAMTNPNGGIADLREHADSAPKPADFGANIAGDYSKATADRWVSRILFNTDDKGFAEQMRSYATTSNKVRTPVGYNRMSAVLQAIADDPSMAEQGYNAAAVQAVPWVHVVGPLGAIGYISDLSDYGTVKSETLRRAAELGDVN